MRLFLLSFLLPGFISSYNSVPRRVSEGTRRKLYIISVVTASPATEFFYYRLLLAETSPMKSGRNTRQRKTTSSRFIGRRCGCLGNVSLLKSLLEKTTEYYLLFRFTFGKSKSFMSISALGTPSSFILVNLSNISLLKFKFCFHIARWSS
jgi:hypothetical protein